MKLLAAFFLLHTLYFALGTTNMIGCLKRRPDAPANWIAFSNEYQRFEHAIYMPDLDAIRSNCTLDAVKQVCRFYYKNASIGVKMQHMVDVKMPSVGRRGNPEIQPFELFGCIEEQLPVKQFEAFSIFAVVLVLSGLAACTMCCSCCFSSEKRGYGKVQVVYYTSEEDLRPLYSPIVSAV